MVEQHSFSSDFDNRYKFNGKELDVETGLYYYGARYYNPQLSIWLSVDPLAEKFPNWNPYNYVMQNPINLIDPTGMEPEDGDPPKKNIIINFLRNDPNKALGNYDNNDFEKNGWHIIDANSVIEARDKLNEYLGNNKANNIFINAHGSAESTYYVRDSDGYNIPDPNNEGSYLQASNSGIVLGDDVIFSNNLYDYNNHYSFLRPNKKSVIEAFIDIGNKINDNQNLILGSCLTARDDKFGVSLSSAITSKVNIYINKDLCTSFAKKTSQGTSINYSDFSRNFQTDISNFQFGWRIYNSSGVTTLKNIKVTSNGVIKN